MHAGTLKDKIDVYILEEMKNSYGEKVRSYVYSFSDRAETWFQSGAEAMHGQLSSADKTMSFRVRFHRTRYNETMVIKWRNDYYNIRSIDQDRNRVFQILRADRIPEDSKDISLT